MKVLVTGGTGVLGREVVDRLGDQADVRILSRRPAERTDFVQGDLNTGEGLAEALDGVDVVAHCASAADYFRPMRDVEQTRQLIKAATETSRPHIVYISIVGVDRIPFGYYKAKLASEKLIEQSGMPWTTLRTTQFHDLALLFLVLATKGPVALVPRGLRGQPVDVGEVADRLAELVLGSPAGRVPDLGGPEVLDAETMVRQFQELTGRRRRLFHPPLVGRVAAGFRAGHHLVADGVRGKRTFEDYLRAKIGPDGSVDLPYELKLRR
ncbi:MAG TPA: SDR family oxidoreductase [Jiangellaceae bacterium]